MTAGLPGVGLSGLFFIASALVALPVEVARTIRGHSSLERWATVLRHLAIAVAMIVSLELVYAALHLAIAQVAVGHVHAGTPDHTAAPDPAAFSDHTAAVDRSTLHLLPLPPVVATLCVIAALLAAAKAAQLLSRGRAIMARWSATSSPPSPRALPARSPSRAPSKAA